MPDALLCLRPQAPTGGSDGSSVNHLGFLVPDLRAAIARTGESGVPVVTASVVAAATEEMHWHADQGIHPAFVAGPDGMRVELMENADLSGPVPHHIHLSMSDEGGAQARHARHFGGQPGLGGRFRTADVPGEELTCSGSGGRRPAPRAECWTTSVSRSTACRRSAPGWWPPGWSLTCLATRMSRSAQEWRSSPIRGAPTSGRPRASTSRSRGTGAVRRRTGGGW